MFGVLMEYHIIFIFMALGLFLGSIFLIWLYNTKQSVITAVILLSLNQLFCIISAVGFFGIAYIGYNQTIGESVVYQYGDMSMFYMVFIVLMWINGIMLFLAIYKYMLMVIHDEMKEYLG